MSECRLLFVLGFQAWNLFLFYFSVWVSFDVQMLLHSNGTKTTISHFRKGNDLNAVSCTIFALHTKHNSNFMSWDHKKWFVKIFIDRFVSFNACKWPIVFEHNTRTEPETLNCIERPAALEYTIQLKRWLCVCTKWMYAFELNSCQLFSISSIHYKWHV